MSRSTLIFIIVLALVIAGGWYFSTVDTQVEMRTIETPVPDNALEG